MADEPRKPAEHRVKFALPVNLRDTAFSTVRLDQSLSDVHVDDLVFLIGLDESVLGKAKVVDVWDGVLLHLPASVLEMEQNPLHRTYSGLSFALSMSAQRQIQPTDRAVALVLLPTDEGGNTPPARTLRPPGIIMARTMPRR